jgi:hypothetical protein
MQSYRLKNEFSIAKAAFLEVFFENVPKAKIY